MVAVTMVSGNEISVVSSGPPKRTQGISCSSHTLTSTLSSVLMLTQDNLNALQDDKERLSRDTCENSHTGKSIDPVICGDLEEKVASLRKEVRDSFSRERLLIQRISEERKRAAHLSASVASKTHRLQRELRNTKSFTTRQSLRRKILRQNTLEVLDSLAEAFSDIPEVEEEKYDECEWQVNTTTLKVEEMFGELGEKIVVIRDARRLLWDSFDGDSSELIASYSNNTLSSVEDVLRKIKEQQHCLSASQLSCPQEKRQEWEKMFGKKGQIKPSKRRSKPKSQEFDILRKPIYNRGMTRKGNGHVNLEARGQKLSKQKRGSKSMPSGRRIPCSMLA